MRHPRLSMGESMLLIHAKRTVIYGVVIVSRNLEHVERTNENDGFKMTALECQLTFVCVYCVNYNIYIIVHLACCLRVMALYL